MSTQVPWLTRSDDAILDFLDDFGLALPPGVIEYNIRTRHERELAYSTINLHLKELRKRGLIEREYPTGGFYSITEKGRAYLADELTPEDLKPVE